MTNEAATKHLGKQSLCAFSHKMGASFGYTFNGQNTIVLPVPFARM